MQKNRSASVCGRCAPVVRKYSYKDHLLPDHFLGSGTDVVHTLGRWFGPVAPAPAHSGLQGMSTVRRTVISNCTGLDYAPSSNPGASVPLSIHVLFAYNYTLCVSFWKKYVQRRSNATTAMVAFTKVYVERIFHFFCFQGWSEGACFLHLLREDHRSSLKVNFFRRGFHFAPLFLRLLWGHMKAKPENFPCQPTEKREITANHSKEKIFCQRRV